MIDFLAPTQLLFVGWRQKRADKSAQTCYSFQSPVSVDGAGAARIMRGPLLRSAGAALFDNMDQAVCVGASVERITLIREFWRGKVT